MTSRQVNRLRVFFTVIFLSSAFFLNAQTINFQGASIDMPSNLTTFDWSTFPENSQDEKGYYGWIRFENTPTQSVQEEFKTKDYKLLAYYPDKVYLFYFPRHTDIAFLQQKGAVSIIPLNNVQKMSESVRIQNIPDWAISQANILLSFTYFDSFSSSEVLDNISKYNSVKIIQQFKNSNTLDISILPSEVSAFTAENFVRWIDVIIPPSEKEDFRGRSIHRSSNLDTGNPTDRRYTGEGVGVMVRDDGVVGPHIDFQGRINNSSTSQVGGTHGDGVAGILAGAGNLNPLNRGMAAGSDVYAVNYVSSFLDSPTLNRVANGEVQITNSSFGNGCNGGYTAVASRVDEQTNTYPQLLHVFSAGNSGTQDCGFGAGSSWGTITGGHKQGKNVIATANTFYDGQLANSSSRGPSTDGRIKPDITAHGQGQISTDENNGYLTFGGTSGAAPGIAGVAAQLYQAYAELNGGILPESGLIKATMLNTANDYGNIGPDFRFGWGLVNGLRAAMLLENGNYLDSTISQSVNTTHTINVPANTKQIKVMLYWTDVEGASGASPALVNDLDLSIVDPANNSFLPYVLDPTPNAGILNAPATNGLDRLNNMEQIVIDNPIAGNYTLNINGFNVPVGPQKYYVVYDIIEEQLTLTYPTGNDRLIAGTTDVIHWDGINLIGNTTVEYSTDSGNSWINIGTTPPSVRNIDWNVPNTVGGNFIVRVTNNGISSQNPQRFSVAPRVSFINFSSVCPTDATIAWAPILEANSYDIYVLGNKYMELVGSTSNTSYSFPITDPTQDIWVAVSASGVVPNNWKSLRTNAVRYNGGGLLNCTLNTDLSLNSINNSAADFTPLCNTGPIIISADILNGGSSPVSNFTISYQLNSDPVVQETFTNTLNTGSTATYTFNTPLSNLQDGNNILRVWNSINGDEYILNDEKILEFNTITSSTLLDFVEDFEATPTIPENWVIDNPDNDLTWEPQQIINGADGSSTQTLYVNNFAYNANGEEDTFTTEYFDLNYNGTPELQFDLAKAQFSASLSDALRVEISADCGQSFNEVYFKDGLDLSTVPGYVQSGWLPFSSNDWRTETIDLTPYLGNDVIVRFSNINGYGNSTFIDNINVIKNETLSVSENPLINAVQVYPNPTQGLVNIALNTNYGNQYSLKVHNVIGQVVWQSTKTDFSINASESIDISEFNSGIYFITVQIGNASVVKKIIKL